VAGVAEMNYRVFLIYNVVGGLGWVFSMTLLGYYFGQIPFVQRHIESVILLVIVVSVLPVALHAWRLRRAAARASR
jgi:membrane-associated protein